MPLFSSQFDRTRPHVDTYAGRHNDPGLPPLLASAAGGAVVGATVVATALLADTLADTDHQAHDLDTPHDQEPAHELDPDSTAHHDGRANQHDGSAAHPDSDGDGDGAEKSPEDDSLAKHADESAELRLTDHDSGSDGAAAGSGGGGGGEAEWGHGWDTGWDLDPHAGQPEMSNAAAALADSRTAADHNDDQAGAKQVAGPGAHEFQHASQEHEGGFGDGLDDHGPKEHADDTHDWKGPADHSDHVDHLDPAADSVLGHDVAFDDHPLMHPDDFTGGPDLLHG
ncbi:hypothetical protein ACG83_34020 [Frankia sp. R43]|uniref:hypothetical protein n=1 Tax=Frankia sp. R43 TaxID=269536 RepID=UPI0006CA12BD|nr:hypothetical protein [Frankia sp. R43]KPM51814.1 hypothetical protein ACG83_34020 [Frankia sp. R43]